MKADPSAFVVAGVADPGSLDVLNPPGSATRATTSTRVTTIRSSRAFSLIELIGVLAIIAIMASVIAPNAVRAIDRAAVRAEQENLRTFADQIKTYLVNNSSLPGAGSWAGDIAAYADMNVTDVQQNRRGVGRVYVLDPDPSKPRVERVLLLSAMKGSLVLPLASSINTAQFSAMWDATSDSSIPLAQGWAGWTNEDARDYFVIQRLNVTGIYSKELKSYTITLQNRSDTGTITTTTTTTNSGGNGNNGNGGGNGNGNNGNGNGNSGSGGNGGGSGTVTTTTTTNTPALPASYLHIFANNSPSVSGTVTASGPVISLTCTAGDRIEMYTTATPTGSASYIYVVSDHGAAFEFNPSGDWVVR